MILKRSQNSLKSVEEVLLCISYFKVSGFFSVVFLLTGILFFTCVDFSLWFVLFYLHFTRVLNYIILITVLEKTPLNFRKNKHYRYTITIRHVRRYQMVIRSTDNTMATERYQMVIRRTDITMATERYQMVIRKTDNTMAPERYQMAR